MWCLHPRQSKLLAAGEIDHGEYRLLLTMPSQDKSTQQSFWFSWSSIYSNYTFLLSVTQIQSEISFRFVRLSGRFWIPISDSSPITFMYEHFMLINILSYVSSRWNRLEIGYSKFSWHQPSFKCKIYWKFTHRIFARFIIHQTDYLLRCLFLFQQML